MKLRRRVQRSSRGSHGSHGIAVQERRRTGGLRRLLRHGAGARSRAAQCVLRPSSPRPCRITRPEFSVFRNGSQEYAKNGVCVGFAHKSKRFRVVPLISGGFGVVKRSGVAEELVVDIICEKLGGKNHQSPSQNSLSPSHIITWSPQCSSLAPKLRFRPPSPGGPPL